MAREDFPGVSYRCGLIGKDYSTLINTSHRDGSVLRRRPGYAPITTGTLGETINQGVGFGGSLIVQGASTYIYGIDLATGEKTDLGTGGSTGCFAVSGGRLYYSDAYGNLVFDTPTAAGRPVGIAAPAAVIGAGTVTGSGGLITAGVHLFRYRYLNSTTGYVSDPSPALSKTLALNDSIAFTVGASGTHIITSSTTGVDKILVEMTTAAGTTFYVGATVDNTAGTATITYADAILSVQTCSSVVYGDDGQTPMPNFTYITDHRGRLFGYKAGENLIAWSRDGFPEGWNLAVYSRKIAILEPNQVLTGMASLYGDLYLFTKYRMIRFVYPQTPTWGTFVPVPTAEGLWSQRCLVYAEGALYGFGANGCWRISGMTPTHLSTEVDPFIEEEHYIAGSHLAFGFYSSTDRSITWMFATTLGEYPTIGVTYSLRTGKWCTREYKAPITSATAAYNEVYFGVHQPVTATTGFIHQESQSAFDGVTAPAIYTVAAGSTATVINTVETVLDCTGLRFTINGETRTIASWTTGSITLGVALTGAPTLGDTGTVGMVEMTIEPEWQLLDEKMARLHRPCYLCLEFEPSTAGVDFEVEFRNNLGSSVVWTAEAADTPPSGVTIVPGSAAMLVSDTGSTGYPGYVAVPISTQNVRSYQFHIHVTKPMEPFGLLDHYLMTPDAAAKLPGVGE